MRAPSLSVRSLLNLNKSKTPIKYCMSGSECFLFFQNINGTLQQKLKIYNTPTLTPTSHTPHSLNYPTLATLDQNMPEVLNPLEEGVSVGTTTVVTTHNDTQPKASSTIFNFPNLMKIVGTILVLIFLAFFVMLTMYTFPNGKPSRDCGAAAWNQSIHTMGYFHWTFWVCPAIAALFSLVIFIFSCGDYDFSGSYSSSSSCSNSADQGVLGLIFIAIYFPLFGTFGGLITASVFAGNQFALPLHTGAVLPVQPVLKVKAGRCHDIPSLAKNYSDYFGELLDPETMDMSIAALKSLNNDDWRNANQTSWVDPRPSPFPLWKNEDGPEYCPWCVDSGQCEDFALLTEQAKYTKSTDAYKDRSVIDAYNYFCSFLDPYKKEVNERPFGCYLDVERETWTYVPKLSHIVDNERYSRSGKQIRVYQAECSASFPCLCTLVNYTDLAQPQPIADTGILASYCSEDANTPECCEYVALPIFSSCLIATSTFGLLMFACFTGELFQKDEKFNFHCSLSVIFLLQAGGALWGVSVVTR